MIRAFLRIALLASLSSGTAAQYTPNFQGSIDLLSSVPSASAKEAAQAASDMLKKNSGASKALVDNKNPSPYLEDFDGSTRRHPAKHWRPGHETPPENVEVADINGKKLGSAIQISSLRE